MTRSRPRDQIAWAGLYMLIGLGALALRLQIASYDPGWVFTDTPGYIRVALEPLTSTDFWAGGRPFSLPLFYKVVGVNLQNYRSPGVLNEVGHVQAVIGALGWTVLAGAVAASLNRRWLRPLSFSLVEAFGLSLHVSQWDSLLLSESMATSTFALMLGLWIVGIGRRDRLERGGPPRKALYWAVTALVVTLYSFSRDSNAFFLLGCGLLSLATLLNGKVRSGPFAAGMLAMGALLLVIFAAQQWTIRESGRWRFPFYGTFLERIYGMSAAREFFIEEGMPLGEWQEDVVPTMPRRAFFDRIQRDPGAQRFVEWMDSRGQFAYAKYLATHPRILLSGPYRHSQMLLSPLSTEYRGQGARTPGWLLLLTDILYPRDPKILFPVLGLGALGALLGLIRGAGQGWWAVPVTLWLLVPPLMLLIWHADSIEIERHAYQIGLQLRLGGWLLLLGLFDLILRRMGDSVLPGRLDR